MHRLCNKGSKMSDTETTTKKAVEILEASLNDMTKNLRLFSLSMRALYAEKNVGTSNDVACKFTELRDKTRDDAKVYLKVILPVTTKFVSSIKDFFDFYEALSYEEWCEMLPSIIEEVRNQKDLVETLKDMHENIMTTLKKREDELKIIMTEFKTLQREYEAETQKMKSKADKRRTCSLILEFIPVVNIFACPLLRLSADEYTAKALAKAVESNTQGAAVLVVAETLIPALSTFIEGLNKAAGFFEVMEEELNSFVKKGETFSQKLTESHDKIMKSNVEKIHPSTFQFYASLQAVRTDFDAISDEGDDANYIEKWLEEKLTEIEKKRCSTRNAFWEVIKEIKGLKMRTQQFLSLTSANKD